MSADESFVNALAAAWPPDRWNEHTLVVAVSGGADSMALLCGLDRLSGNAAHLVVGHVNHGLRGAESDADEQFVVDICKQLAIDCEIHRAAARPEVGGIEEAARETRYAFLCDLAQRRHARFVVTAHTADDQVETILHRILRGTGPRGLAGIAERRLLAPSVTLVRPMLALQRKAGVAFLDAISQPYRTDSSNTDTRMTRNRLRHDLLPELREQYNQNVDDALLRLGRLSSQANQEIDRQVDKLESQAVRSSQPDRMVLDCDALDAAGGYLTVELLKRVWRGAHWPEQSMNHRTWESLVQLTVRQEEASPASEPPSVRRDLPGGIRADREGKKLILTRAV